MKSKNVVLLIVTEMFYLASLLASIGLLVVVFVLLPLYLYQSGGWDLMGLTFLLFAWIAFCAGLILKK